VLQGISIPFTSREKCPSQDCDGIVDKANKKEKIFPCFFGKLELNILLLTACTWVAQSKGDMFYQVEVR